MVAVRVAEKSISGCQNMLSSAAARELRVSLDDRIQYSLMLGGNIGGGK